MIHCERVGFRFESFLVVATWTENHEDLVDFLVTEILIEHATALMALRGCLSAYEDTDLDIVVLATIMTASALEENLEGDRVLVASEDLWRLSAVLSCDAILLRRSSGRTPTVKDAMVHWRKSRDHLFR